MHWLLLPLSWIYDAVTSVRNFMYDHGILSSTGYEMPVICVGNLAVGGTGKTPFIEYIIRLLQAEGLNVAVLSRGYKRKSHGYVLADGSSTASDIGDEPYQIKSKFPDVTVAVDADRREGISRLMTDARTSGMTDAKTSGMTNAKTSDVDVILLDDAFQHRRVQAGLNILLTDNNRLFNHDCLLPCGRLRENAKGSKRADIVIATKVKADVDVDDALAERTRIDLGLEERQSLFFSGIKYGNPYHAQKQIELSRLADYNILLIVGIANPEPLTTFLSQYAEYDYIQYADHHDFTPRDYTYINEAYQKMPTDKPRIILTTEKDMARMDEGQMPMYDSVYALPIEVEILNNGQTTLNNKILDYVRENSRNSTIPQGEDDFKS